MPDNDYVRKEVKKGKRYIDQHLYEDLDAKKVASVLGHSVSSLWRYFTSEGGSTVDQYIRLRRIQMAARNLRNGCRIEDEASKCGYKTVSGFARAFLNVYGITPWEFSKTRGESLMQEPKIMEKMPFYVVGYVLPGDGGFRPEDTGAYWLDQDFQKVSPREYARIGGASDMVGVWTTREGEPVYLLGALVKKIQYIPKTMAEMQIPGGTYAVFPVEGSKDNSILGENVRVTWFYALRQWLPDSDYSVDESRTAYEYYLQNENSICIPVIPKIRQPKRTRKTEKRKSQE